MLVVVDKSIITQCANYVEELLSIYRWGGTNCRHLERDLKTLQPDDDVVDRLRRRLDAATDALDQCDHDHRMSPGRRPVLLVYRVVCTDENTTLWPEEDLGNLRVALNALVRVFRFV